MPAAASSFDQSSYQVRFEWGASGLARLAPSDIVVVVDVLRFSSTVIQAVERGEDVALDGAAHAVSINGASVAAAATGLVVLGGLRNAAAIARAVLAEQERRGVRTSIAVIACGERTSRDPDAPVRFAVEDLLGAGAVIAALADLGVDHSSPEAAVAGEGFRALRGAAKHLLTASGSGRELDAAGARDEVLAAAAVDAASVVPVLRDGVFTAL
ncbi:2-phosphosulfolactate phosphatase [Microbacterium sp. Root180]|uniref:2-phosphosulfolactate phosphatase n=1 Tax=Microbacterium sp. Root180 TaxID=1736483 RepID=UPI0006FEC014|nr:2-phosphosulfolactate phosphatase [Microbacterium sp. Root180]KRB38514.1 phosphosulfolactate phosphohydrolase [Microbacterium sp. Root180]